MPWCCATCRVWAAQRRRPGWAWPRERYRAGWAGGGGVLLRPAVGADPQQPPVAGRPAEDPELASLRAEIERLQRRLKELEAARPAAPAAPEKPPAGPEVTVARPLVRTLPDFHD